MAAKTSSLCLCRFRAADRHRLYPRPRLRVLRFLWGLLAAFPWAQVRLPVPVYLLVCLPAAFLRVL